MNIPVSFEFFPPRSDEAEARLSVTRQKLAALNPEYFSVTFGAGGSTRSLTLETVLASREDTGVDSAPHISCIGFAVDEIVQTLTRYQQAGIKRLVALRGDMPSGTTGFGELRFADELVRLIREQFGDAFQIHVAAYPEVHPQALGASSDFDKFCQKVEAGADAAITQYFFNADAYFSFVDRCQRAGVTIPIVPGIMPITNYSGLKRFSETCGAEIPRWMMMQLRDFGDDRNAIQQFGIDVVTRLCESLVNNGAPGLHFYSMNQHEAATAICTNLGLGAD